MKLRAELRRWQVCDWDFFYSLEWLRSIGNIIHGVKNISAVIPGAASVTNANNNILKDDETLLMLKCFLINFLRPNGSFAMFAPIAVQ